MRERPARADPASPVWTAVDEAIGDGAEAAFSFLARLVAAPSTVGRELPAQQIVAAELGRLGFEVTELPVPAETADAAPGGVAQASYAGRPDVLGRINPGGSPSLLLNGHVDVVPAESGRWAGDPFVPTRADGWLTRRGAGDMKGGFAMGLLAVAALRRAGHPPSVRPAGFRAEGYLIDQDHPLVDALAAAHQRVHGVPPRRVVMGSTTDARYYLNQFGVPAVVYGPRSRNIHGTDEAVELASIVSGARALARFMADFFAADAFAGGVRR